MNNKNGFTRFMIIDKALRNKTDVTLEFLIDYVNDRITEPVDRRTIQYDIQLMRYDQQLGFMAPIVFDRRTHAYKYKDKDYTLMKALQKHMDLIPD